MKFNEFMEKVTEIMADAERVDFRKITLRLLGLSYGKYMYNKKCKSLSKEYEYEEVLSAFENSWKLTSQFNRDDFNTMEYYINTLISYVKKNLENGYYTSSDQIEDDFEI